MKYECVNCFDKVFIELPNSDIELDKVYLVYNDKYYEEATEYFKKLGLNLTDASIIEGDVTELRLTTKSKLEVKVLYNISDNIKISLSFDNEGNECIVIILPL